MLTSHRIKRFLLAAASGLLLFVALPPHDMWWAAWFGLVPLLLAIRTSSWREAALLGLMTGAVANYGAFHWLTVVMNEFTKLGVFTYLVMLIMALYQGVPYMVWALFLRKRFSGSLRSPAGIWAFFSCAVSLPVLEFFYPIVFPWYLANTQHSQANLTGVIELGGCGLLSLAMVCCNLALATLLVKAEDSKGYVWPLARTRSERGAVVALGALALGFCWGFSVYRNAQIEALQAEAPKLTIGLVQPNHWIKQVAPVEALHDYQRLSLELVERAESEGVQLDFLMWPESAVRTPAPPVLTERGPVSGQDPQRLPLDLLQVPLGQSRPAGSLAEERESRSEILSLQRGHTVPLLFGSTLQDWSPGARGPMPTRPPLYNCGVMLDGEGKVVGVAPKVKLLLFGETIPLSQYFPQVYQILPLASALLPGREAQVFDFQGSRLGMMVCYEDLLPWFHYELAAKKPQVLLNLTNDAWFGKTAEAEAHLALAKLRAVEGRVPLVRSTSSGVSAFVDGTGRVTGQLDMNQRGTIYREVALLDVETLFESFGDTVVWFGLFSVLGFLAFTRRKRSS